MRFYTENCPKCKWFESNTVDISKATAFACRSPKWEWTDEDYAEWLKSIGGKITEWTMRDVIPPFKISRHCDFKPMDMLVGAGK